MKKNKLAVAIAVLYVILGAVSTASAHGTWIELDTVCADL
jgi:hypothetical protein